MYALVVTKRISIIAAVAANGVIGRSNGLPWHLAGDLKWFKGLTLGHHMIMGRRTFDSVGKPLPGRTTVVITRDASYSVPGVVVVPTIEQAIEIASHDDEPFICGGGEIYRQMLHRANRMYITQVHAEVEGDTLFPEFDDVNEWKLVDREDFEADAKNDYAYSFLTYDRVGAATHPIAEEG
jgi:dihydrofolate reductase